MGGLGSKAREVLVQEIEKLVSLIDAISRALLFICSWHQVDARKFPKSICKGFDRDVTNRTKYS